MDSCWTLEDTPGVYRRVLLVQKKRTAHFHAAYQALQQHHFCSFCENIFLHGTAAWKGFRRSPCIASSEGWKLCSKYHFTVQKRAGGAIIVWWCGQRQYERLSLNDVLCWTMPPYPTKRLAEMHANATAAEPKQDTPTECSCHWWRRRHHGSVSISCSKSPTTSTVAPSLLQIHIHWAHRSSWESRHPTCPKSLLW